MKPILFAANATNFTTNGLGVLDPTECVVVEERNGQYELECVVPVDSPHFEDIANNMILAVIPGDGFSLHPVAERQAFRIYHLTEPLNGLVTINARHITYDLSYNTVMPCTADSVTTALLAIESHMVETNQFQFNTDKSTIADFRVSVPQTARQLLGGQEWSILAVYGGEYQWNNFNVNLWNHRGQDTDVTLRYGKNITDITQEENLEAVVTGIVPYWSNDGTVVTLPEKVVDSQYASQYPYKRTIPVDLSSDFDDEPSEGQLRSRAQAYITENNIGVPKISIKVSFVALWQTEEYKDIAPLERVHLCDTVGVVFEKYGIDTRAEVVKTEWDCLAERYLSIELGEARSEFAQTIADIGSGLDTEIAETKTELERAIDAATAAITGVNGGYIKINSTADGKPYEILIMDNEDAAQAQKVWRWNLAGWGYSSHGINGPYTLAATQNGEIVADFITTGTLTANLIKAGTLSDLGNNLVWNLTTGALSAKHLSIDAPNFKLYEDGKIVSISDDQENTTEINKGALSSRTDDEVLWIRGTDIYFEIPNSDPELEGSPIGTVRGFVDMGQRNVQLVGCDRNGDYISHVSATSDGSFLSSDGSQVSADANGSAGIDATGDVNIRASGDIDLECSNLNINNEIGQDAYVYVRLSNGNVGLLTFTKGILTEFDDNV